MVTPFVVELNVRPRTKNKVTSDLCLKYLVEKVF